MILFPISLSYVLYLIRKCLFNVSDAVGLFIKLMSSDIRKMAGQKQIETHAPKFHDCVVQCCNFKCLYTDAYTYVWEEKSPFPICQSVSFYNKLVRIYS